MRTPPFFRFRLPTTTYPYTPHRQHHVGNVTLTTHSIARPSAMREESRDRVQSLQPRKYDAHHFSDRCLALQYERASTVLKCLHPLFDGQLTEFRLGNEFGRPDD